MADSKAGWAGALEGLTKGLSEQLERQIELDRQKELLRYQYELEAKRFQQQQALEERRRREAAEVERQRQIAAEVERQRQISADDAKKKLAEVEKRNALSTGTGFFISQNGYLVTNAHVVGDYENIAVKDRTGRIRSALVIAIDKQRDLALLKVDGNFPALRIDQTGRTMKGQRVLAIGYPQVSIQGSESKVTDGVVSSLSGLRNNDDWIQISVPIQGGNSGGPLINESGTVIGIVVATVNAQKFLSITGSLPQNINYAIKAKVLLSFLAEQQIRNTGNTNKKDSIDAVDRATALVIAKHGEPLVFAETKTNPVPQPKVATAKDPEAIKRQTVESIARVHPDFRDIIRDPEFDRWRNALPEARRQELYVTWNADVAVKAISEYKSTKKANNELPQNSRNIAASENLQRGKVSYDRQGYEEALIYFRKAAEDGDAAAQTYLGFMYQAGQGVTKDNAETVRWYRKAAEQGNADAQIQLGVRYEAGQGVTKDDSEAVNWYRKAAEMGNARAQCYLGGMYESGRGIAKDYGEAAKWYRKAAEQGYAIAQNNLANLYANGKLVMKDDVEAVRWYRKAAGQGDESAKNELRKRGLF